MSEREVIMSIQVSSDVLDGILSAIDKSYSSGFIAIFDFQYMVELLESMGQDQAAAWVAENRNDYINGILYGFERK